MSKKMCKVQSGRFCYVCVELIISKKGYPITELLKEAYLVNMSPKIHFLYPHLDFFSENHRHVSGEHGERFHQDLKFFEQNYQGYWDEAMLGDYCWSIMRDIDTNKYKKS
ncbi:unnamed protein product [Parnassius mnemosyne]|uniref:Uncharacterized protein n=1 Tax=Parnassius mnemosyne TaxID=213953 RepID=A0AAV1L0M2_9NEOP